MSPDEVQRLSDKLDDVYGLVRMTREEQATIKAVLDAHVVAVETRLSDVEATACLSAEQLAAAKSWGQGAGWVVGGLIALGLWLMLRADAVHGFLHKVGMLPYLKQ